MNIGGAVLEVLKSIGVKKVFGVPGSLSQLLWYIKQDPDIDFVLFRTELGAAYAGVSYHKISSRPVALLVTIGLGAFNALPGAIAAFYEYAPLIIFSETYPPKYDGTNMFQEASGKGHTISQRRLYKCARGYALRVTSIKDVVPTLKKLVKLASEMLYKRRLPRPIFVELTAKLLAKTLPEKYKRAIINIKRASDQSVGESIKNRQYIEGISKRILNYIEKAERPAVIVGGGAHAHKETVRNLLSQLGWPIISTLKGKDVADDLPTYLGVAGYSNPNLLHFLTERDVILSIGVGFNSMFTLRRKLGKQSKLIVISDFGKRAYLKHVSPEIIAIGNTENVLAYLTAILSKDGSYSLKKEHKETNTIRFSEMKTTKKLSSAAQSFIESLSNLLPPELGEYIIVAESILESVSIPIPPSSYYITYTNLAPIGCSIAGGVGAKIAAPAMPVLVFTGDFGFYMDATELMTLVEYNLQGYALIPSTMAD